MGTSNWQRTFAGGHENRDPSVTFNGNINTYFAYLIFIYFFITEFSPGSTEWSESQSHHII